MLAREALHLGEQKTHVLGMLAVLAGAHVLDFGGRLERRLRERRRARLRATPLRDSLVNGPMPAAAIAVSTSSTLKNSRVYGIR